MAVHETQSDSTGAFRSGEIPDGDYMLSARLPGFLGARTRVRVSASMLTGSVLLQAVIGSDGQMRDIEVVSPVNADLEEEAVNAVSQWEFSPTWLNCKASRTAGVGASMMGVELVRGAPEL